MGPDLTARLLEVGGVRVERVVIESAREMTFYATVAVTAGSESHEVDARPSDALSLAVRVGAPVFVAAEVIDQSGVRSGVFASRPSHAEAGESGAGTEHEWRSLSADIIRLAPPPRGQGCMGALHQAGPADDDLRARGSVGLRA